ncbi:S41 family peptidase [Myxococcota bacterium]|nr:S41 family peptidase [Myxococcota bacterium]
MVGNRWRGRLCLFGWVGWALASWAVVGCGAVHDLRVEPNTLLLPADGKRDVSFQVTATDVWGARVDVTKKARLIVRGEGADLRDPRSWEEKKFRIAKVGRYSFQAEIDEQRSPEVVVQALDQKSYVYAMLRDVYFWADKIPQEDPQRFGSPEEILQALRYDKAKGGYDRWSYITNLQSHTDFDTKGEYVGIGFNMAYDPKGKLRVSLAHADSPAGKAGLERGQLILSINGKALKEIEEQNLWATIFGEPSAGVAVEMTIQEEGKEARSLRFLKGTIHVRSVFLHKIIERAGKKIGYLLFNQFIEPSIGELDEAFASFRAQGIDELILDLRYNGGGRLSTALYLASLLMGRETHEKVFFQYLHNEKNKIWNQNVPFQRGVKNALSLKRLFVIAMGGTASASEVLINGLRPHLPVVVVGQTTHGKPMGMYVYNFFDKVFAPISFKLANAEGKGEFYEGIVPEIEAADDITRQFGDPEEAPLKAALESIAGPSGQSRLPLRILTPQKQIPMDGFRRIIGAF